MFSIIKGSNKKLDPPFNQSTRYEGVFGGN